MYLGKHDMRYWPYLCSASPFSLYLSVGFTIGALSLVPCGSRGANWVQCQQFDASSNWQWLHTRRCSEASLATSFALSAVDAKVRTASRGLLAERTAWPNGRPTAWRRAIMCVSRVLGLRAAVCGAWQWRRRRRGRRRQWSCVPPSKAGHGSELETSRDAAERAFQICCRPAHPHHHHSILSFASPFTVGVRPFTCGYRYLHHCRSTTPSRSTSPNLLLDATYGSPTHTSLTSCPAYYRTSSSTMTRRSAARSVSRSSTCLIGTFAHALAVTRFATPRKFGEAPAAPANALFQICQFCFNNIKTTMNGLCPACRRPYDESTIEFKNITPEEYVLPPPIASDPC